MKVTELVVEVEQEVLVSLHEQIEYSPVQDSAPFQVLHTSTFVPWHQKHYYLRQKIQYTTPLLDERV